MAEIAHNSRALIVQSFTKGFNEAQALYKSDKLVECIAECYKLLDEPAIPRYHRIRTLCLLANIVPDWNEAWGHLEEAKVYYRLVRFYHPEGQDAQVDAEMKELWEGLQDMEDTLEDDASDGAEFEDRVDERVAEEFALVQTARDEQDELDDIEARLLGMSKEAMYKKTADKAASKSSQPREPKLIGSLLTGVASTSTSATTATSQHSAEWHERMAHSRSYGFGGGKPFQDPMKKREDQQNTVTAHEFLDPTGHEPVIARARSLRKRPSAQPKVSGRNTLPNRPKQPADLQPNSRPPAVLPQFAIELFGTGGEIAEGSGSSTKKPSPKPSPSPS